MRSLLLGLAISSILLLGPTCKPLPSLVSIHEAEWESDGEVRVDGTAEADPGSRVWLYNADTGAFLGDAPVDSSGSWAFRCPVGGPPCRAPGGSGAFAPIETPCRVEARLVGSRPARRAIEGVPSDCALHPPNQPIACEITSPASDLQEGQAIAPGASVFFASEASDPEGLPLAFVWNFGGGADLRSREAVPGQVSFDASGRYRVTLTVTEPTGGRCTDSRFVDVGPVADDLPPRVAEQPAPGAPGSGDGDHAVVAFNDLGMHCADLGSTPFQILPPFNTINAQAIERGGLGALRPRLLEASAVELRYSAASSALDPAAPGSINSTSQNWPVGALAGDATLAKSDFWDSTASGSVASLLFPGLDPIPDEGLQTLANSDHGRFMPGITDPYRANLPEPFSGYEEAFGWFSAQGIPITPVDDAGYQNSYPLLRIQAVAAGSGQVLASVDTVAPVSSEVDCRDCHVQGRVGADSGARSDGPVFASPASPDRADVEAAAKTNILRLHDHHYAAVTGSLENGAPVLCASCHASAALSSVGGPTGDPAVSTMSSAMHAFHGLLQTDPQGDLLRDAAGDPILRGPGDESAQALIPFGPDVPMEANCFLCHPGKITQCFRGAMFEAGLDCADCHGDMLAVGAVFPLRAQDGTPSHPRNPWIDEPRCESCHTGDAVDRLPGPLVRAVAFDPQDPAATPVVAANRRFAEEAGALYRNSRGHGGIACEGCHGSPHAIWPNPNPDANDNVTATQLQGHAGTLIECSVCHDAFGQRGGNLAGPHGLHPVNDPWWIKGGEDWHGRLAKRANASGSDACAACHGVDHRGTRLSRVPVDRVLRDSEGAVRAVVPAGTAISCDLCHSLEKSFGS